MQESVKQDRALWIGGSDIPAIMGLSKFRTRWQVLREKAWLETSDFEGNAYTEYGNIMEPKIREYVNHAFKRNFYEAVKYTDDCRFHLDGWDEEFKEVLEIKTTSQIHSRLSDYKTYLAQLLPYMSSKGAEVGLLAVYERPEDFSEGFDPSRLTVYVVRFKDWEKGFWQDICFQLDRFRDDLKRLKENPLLTEEDLVPNEIVDYAGSVAVLEERLARMKEIEALAKEAKKELRAAMEKHGITRWITNNGTKVTLVADGNDTVISEFNLERFKKERPEVYAEYLEDRMKPGRAGYVKITLPKE